MTCCDCLGRRFAPSPPRLQKKSRTHQRPGPGAEADKTPKSLVLRRGKVAKPVAELISDVRRLMMPHTAPKLKERKCVVRGLHALRARGAAALPQRCRRHHLHLLRARHAIAAGAGATR